MWKVLQYIIYEHPRHECMWRKHGESFQIINFSSLAHSPMHCFDIFFYFFDNNSLDSNVNITDKKSSGRKKTISLPQTVKGNLFPFLETMRRHGKVDLELT